MKNPRYSPQHRKAALPPEWPPADLGPAAVDMTLTYLEGTVLRPHLAPADNTSDLQGQHFVLGTLPPIDVKPAQNPLGEKSAPEDDKGRRAFVPEETSGEGAASALESLRKREQTRTRTRLPDADDRPTSD